MKMENKTRNSNIELLRIVLMTCILCWHVLVHGYGFANIGNEGFVYRLNMPLTLVLSCLLAPATYTFVFISGYFGLHFHWRKFVELLLGCIVVSVGGSIFLYGQGRNDIIDLWRSFFPIYPQGCWWFMTAYIWLYMLSPLIDEGIRNLGQRKLRNLVLLFSIFLSVGILTMQKSVGSDLGGVLTIYLIGRYMRLYHSLSQKQAMIVYSVSLALMLIILFCFWVGLNKFSQYSAFKGLFYFLSFCNPLIISMSVGIFFMVYKLPAWSNLTFNKIASGSLFIYLITEKLGLGWGYIYEPLAKILDKNLMQGCVVILLIVIICLLAGCIIQYCVHCLTGVAITNYKKIIKKLNYNI